jgi:hypothetical protein
MPIRIGTLVPTVPLNNIYNPSGRKVTGDVVEHVSKIVIKNPSLRRKDLYVQSL